MINLIGDSSQQTIGRACTLAEMLAKRVEKAHGVVQISYTLRPLPSGTDTVQVGLYRSSLRRYIQVVADYKPGAQALPNTITIPYPSGEYWLLGQVDGVLREMRLFSCQP